MLDENGKDAPPPPHPTAGTCVTENMPARACAVPASQSQGRGDFEPAAHTQSALSTHVRILSVSQWETAVLHSSILTQVITFYITCLVTDFPL